MRLKRRGEVLMPSDIRPEPEAPVIAYRLTDEELAQYRERGMDMGTPNKIDRDALYARFAAGEGADHQGRKALAKELGCHITTITYHLRMWERAGRPESRKPDESAAAPVGDQMLGVEEGGPTPDQVPVTVDSDTASEIRELVETGQVDPELIWPPEGTEVGMAVIQCAHGGAVDPAAGDDQTGVAVVERKGDDVRVVATGGTVEEALAEADAQAGSPEPALEDRDQGAAPASQPLNPMAEAFARAIRAQRRQPGQNPTCQVCRKPVDVLQFYADEKSGLSGHRDCVQAAVRAQETETQAERLPEVGEVYEGSVDRVDINGRFALVHLLDFHRDGSWIRGKLPIQEVLRAGYCEDVRDWLQPGDLINVKVLKIEEGNGNGLRRWRVSLSSKQAPAHPRERIPLEAQPPITARGAEVAAMLESELVGADTRATAQTASQYVTEQSPEQPAAVTSPESGLGLCATCVHHIDRMCPYPEWFQERMEIPDDELPDRHKGVRIQFGRRPVVECALYRKEQGETA